MCVRSGNRWLANRKYESGHLRNAIRGGQPYRLVPLGEGRIRVVSSGPNKHSPHPGVDDDDIYSDMPVSPRAAIIAQKNRQWLFAFAVAAGSWALLAWLYMRYGR